MVAGADPDETSRAHVIISHSPKEIFPLEFNHFKEIAMTYRINIYAITDLITIERLFQAIDWNFDGFITAEEMSNYLPMTLLNLEEEAKKKQKRDAWSDLQAKEGAMMPSAKQRALVESNADSRASREIWPLIKFKI